MGSDVDDADVPWGKYTYHLDGLATGCYLEGATLASSSNTKRLRFRVELPARCFVLSVAVKLPTAPDTALHVLQYVEIERTLTNGDYQLVYHPEGDACLKSPSKSPTSVDQTSERPPEEARKKVMEVRRAADALRITISDIDTNPPLSTASSSVRRRRSSHSDDASDTDDFIKLGIVVVGYVRGQTPAPSRIKILLQSSCKLNMTNADRAEVDALLGLALLGNRRYRQAAELLQRASEEVIRVARIDEKSGFSVEEALAWAAELNLLSAYAYFEHLPNCNDGTVQLILVAQAGFAQNGKPALKKRDYADLSAQYLDTRTELLIVADHLVDTLVNFLADSRSLAVKLACARMIEFTINTLGCVMAKFLPNVLNQILRLYPEGVSFGARERAAANSFQYDSMEDCYEQLIGYCCRIFALMEHGALQRLYDTTLIPVLLDAFHESKYLHYDPDTDEDGSQERTNSAVAQTLRLICFTISLVGIDAQVPTSVIARVLNMLVLDEGHPRTTMILRRAALHAWDAFSLVLIRRARGNSVKAYAEHFKVLAGYIPRLLVEVVRPPFEYVDDDDDEDDDDEDKVPRFAKEEYIMPENSQVLQDMLRKRRKKRTAIVDRHTLRRVLGIIRDICGLLGPTSDNEERYLSVIISLQQTIGQSIADVFLSSLIDVSYCSAAMSGIGAPEANSMFEYGDINTQLSVVSEVLEQLFEAYWSCVALLPERERGEAVKNAPIRVALGWCVDRMKHTAPPCGMQVLMIHTLRGLRHDMNTPMFALPPVPEAPHEVTFIAIYRAYIQWFAKANDEEAFDLIDILLDCVAEDLMATDLIELIKTIGDQHDQFKTRTEESHNRVALLVANTAPKRPDLAMGSLKALEETTLGKQRIANGFPKSSRSNPGSFSRRMQFSSAPRTDPMSKSLYMHIALASCFDRFDALARAAKQRAGPSYMGLKIDAFVEHAALCLRCLTASVKNGHHRDYVSAVFGDIFSTCLAMQANGDGRVRLAGVEIFAAALDTLFKTERRTSLFSQQELLKEGELAIVRASSGLSNTCVPSEANSAVTDLSVRQDADIANGSTGSPETTNVVRTNSNSSASPAGNQENGEHADQSEGEDISEVEKRVNEICEKGGSFMFYAEDASGHSDVMHEEKGWQMLSLFISSTISVGKCVDFIVQRACLEYLKGCLLNVLCQRSTGASVLGFDHIEGLWEAVKQLVSSPWYTLHDLVMWVLCAIANVSIYSTVMVKGRSARQRQGQLHDFAFHHIFPTAETFLKSGIRETRIWGMHILQVYVKARELNSNIVQTVPAPPFRTLRAVEVLKNDYEDEIRDAVDSLVDIYYNSSNKKSSSSMTSLTAQAQNFMTRRYQGYDVDQVDNDGIKLWFPAVSSGGPDMRMGLYCNALEAFANLEVVGGEETEVTPHEPDGEEGEEGFDPDFDDEDEEEEEVQEAFEFDDEESDGDVENDADFEDAQMQAAAEKSSSEEDDEDLENEEDGFVNLEAELNLVSADNELDEDDATEEDSLGTTLAGEEEPFVQGVDRESPNASDSTKNLSGSYEEGDEEVEEDHEFSNVVAAKTGIEALSKSSELYTEVLDENTNASAETEGSNSYDNDFVDEDEVINVTDEDDVLVDLDKVPVERKLTPVKIGALSSRRSLSPKSRSYSHIDMKARRSVSGPSPELNPDLAEDIRVLRRKGSFTSRLKTGAILGEGEIPILARRRSVDVSSVSILDAIPDRAKGDNVSPSFNSRLSKRRSKTVSSASFSSPRATSSQSNIAGKSEVDEKVAEYTNRGEKNALAEDPGRSLFKKPSRGDDAREEAGEKLAKAGSKEFLIGKAFLDHSPRGMRAPRGIALENEEKYEVRPVAMKTSEKPGAKKAAEKRSSRPTGRRLPRAPAFVKGGGIQRKVPAPLSLGTSGAEQGTGRKESSDPSSTEKGRSSGLSSSGKSRLPRAKSQTGKSRVGVREEVENRPDRSHRYSRRVPVSLPDIKYTDELEKDDLLDDAVLQSGDDSKGARVGTPTADTVGTNSIADDQPGSTGRRRSKRDVMDSKHYKSLLEQISLVDQIGQDGKDEIERTE